MAWKLFLQILALLKQLVVSIDNNLEIRPVLGLFEGVLTGAAIISDFINGKPVTDLIR